MPTINTSEEDFKTSPLGFLMAVFAKYQAYVEKHASESSDTDTLNAGKIAGDILDNFKIELSKKDELCKEPTNEAVLVHVIESFEESEQEVILNCIVEYMNILEAALQNIDQQSEDGRNLLNEYYDLSRIGLLLNCYFGKFENDDFFYGTLAAIAESEKGNGEAQTWEEQNLIKICENLATKAQKADVSLSFDDFFTDYYQSSSGAERELIYNVLIRSFTEKLFDKVLTQTVTEEEVNQLICAKQIQRKFEKLMLK